MRNIRVLLPALLSWALLLIPLVSSAQTPPNNGSLIVPNGGAVAGGGGSGTVTSVATSCAVSGGPITTSGTITGNVTPDPVATGSAYTFLLSDCGKLKVFSDGTARAPSLPTASFSADNFINISNSGAGAETITPTTGTICGASTLVLQQNQGMGIALDGSGNWQCSGGPYAPVNSGTIALARMPNLFSMPAYNTGHSQIYPNILNTATSGTSITGVANSYYCTPFPIGGTVTISALAARVVATSTGNSSAALQGAVYYDLVTTSGVHRPGTLIDYADGGGGFATGSAASVTSAMHNGTDTITIPGGGGPGLIWTCLQKFDATATFGTPFVPDGLMVGLIGTAVVGNALSATAQMGSVVTAGSAFGGTNWVNFTSSTSWTESTGTSSPYMAIVVN